MYPQYTPTVVIIISLISYHIAILNGKSFLEYISVKSLLIMWIFFRIESASPV